MIKINFLNLFFSFIFVRLFYRTYVCFGGSLYCFQKDITFQEVPNEVSLILSISGCSYKCKGCHSTELWKEKNGTFLSKEVFEDYLNEYKNLLTCVCFFGGEWHEETLIELLMIAQLHNLKTCLYSGAEMVSNKIKDKLTYLKLGPWIEKFGGLESTHTNQRFIELSSGKILNHYFLKARQGGNDAEAYRGTN